MPPMLFLPTESTPLRPAVASRRKPQPGFCKDSRSPACMASPLSLSTCLALPRFPALPAAAWPAALPAGGGQRTHLSPIMCLVKRSRPCSSRSACSQSSQLTSESWQYVLLLPPLLQHQETSGHHGTAGGEPMV